MIIIRSAVPAFVAHALVPFSTQSLPSLVACARSAAASDPASASDSAKPASSSPRAIGLSQRSFCAAVPCFTSIVVGIALWMPIETAKAASAAEISSSAIRYVTLSRPMPSYSSGVHMPRKPSLPISSITSRGKWLVRSHSAANGSIFSRANSRASSTTCSRTSIAVCIEPLARFPAELSFGDHFLEQRRRPVLLHVEPLLQHFHDREAHVETDQIGERQGTERMTHAELHHLIDRLRRRDALVHAEDRFVDHRHQHAVRHKPRSVIHLDRNLSQRLYDCDDSFYGVVRRLWSTYYLDEFHDRDGIHEMHADDFARPIGVLGKLRDGNRGGVAGQYRLGRRKAAKGGKDLELDVRVLGHRLHHDLGIFRGLERLARLDPGHGIYRQLMTDDALLLQALETLFDCRKPAGERVIRDIDEHSLPAVLREHMRDTVAHRSGTHHRDPAHPASQMRGCFQRAPITASVPANSTSVVTMPASGPNGPPSTQGWRPGVYSTTGTWNS